MRVCVRARVHVCVHVWSMYYIIVVAVTASTKALPFQDTIPFTVACTMKWASLDLYSTKHQIWLKQGTALVW